MKKRILTPWFLVLVMAFTFARPPALASGSTGFAVTNTYAVNLREGPNGALIEKLPNGHDCYVFEERQDAKGQTWYRVATVVGDYNRTGWVRGDLLTLSRDVFTGIVEIAAGDFHLVGLRADGTVVAMGDSGKGSCDVTGWTDIASVGACFLTSIGVRRDGTAVRTGIRANFVTEWVGIACAKGFGDFAVGIGTDGTATLSEYQNDPGLPEGEHPRLTNVADIAMAFEMTACLFRDGTVKVYRETVSGDSTHYGDTPIRDAENWTDIVGITAGQSFLLGLKKDGTVAVAGGIEAGTLDVSGWTDIVAIASSGYGKYALGLKKDGTVVAAGRNDTGQCDVSGWRDIVAIGAGVKYAVGLKSDGTVAFAGAFEFMGR